MSTRFINEGARRLQPYSPGMPIEHARSKYQVDSFIKLASNENAFGPAPSARALLEKAWSVERYPDPDQRRLTEALAKYHEVEPENIIVGAGSSELLDRVARLVLCPGRKAVYSQYAFSLYRQYTLNCNAEPVEVPANSPQHAQAYGHDLAAMAQVVDGDTSLVYIANPNNPTGTFNQDTEIIQLLDKIPEDTLVVVDQAYYEYARSQAPHYPDLYDWHLNYPNLIVTRTFSKVYALAGLRVGYAIAEPNLADWLRRIRQPFNVNQLAQEAALASLNDAEYARDCAEKNAGEMKRVESACAELGFETIASVANFVSIELPIDAEGVYQELMRQGIIARTLKEYSLVKHLRLTLGLREENDRALAVLRQCFAND